MRKRELDARVDNIVYDATHSTSIRQEVERLLIKLDEARKVCQILYRACMVGEEQLSGGIMVEYIASDIKQMRYALTRARKRGARCQ